MANLLQIHGGFRIGHLFGVLTLLAEKKSIDLFFGSYHEVAVAHAANQLLEEVPRLQEQHGRHLHGLAREEIPPKEEQRA
jgi:hypothetical protein